MPQQRFPVERWRAGFLDRLNRLKQGATPGGSMSGLAGAIGVDPATVARWFPSENPRSRGGRRRKPTVPGGDNLAAMAALGWSVDWLLTGEGEPMRLPATVGSPSANLIAERHRYLLLQLSRRDLPPDLIDEEFGDPEQSWAHLVALAESYLHGILAKRRHRERRMAVRPTPKGGR